MLKIARKINQNPSSHKCTVFLLLTYITLSWPCNNSLRYVGEELVCYFTYLEKILIHDIMAFFQGHKRKYKIRD